MNSEKIHGHLLNGRCSTNPKVIEIGINTMNWVDSVQDRDYWRASGFHKPWR